jgi:L-threonylcarbamoyladenylate synthase
MQVIGLTNLEKNFEKIVEVLDKGGLVIFPTETCYGALVRADLEGAVTKLLAYKQRPAGKAISVGRGTSAEALEYLQEPTGPSKLRTLAEKFLPGPVTLVGISSGKVDKRLETEEGTLGVRVPAYEPLLKFLSYYKYPVTTTSANSSGEPTPYSPDGLFKYLSAKKKEMIDILVDAGSLPHNPPSLVIDSTQTDKVYRPGLLTARDLEEGEVFLSQSQEQTAEIAAKSVKSAASIDSSVPVVYLLEGEMGAGKTQFAKGIAQGLGIESTVNSPSYNLVKEYSNSTGQIFYHADLWRLTESLTLQGLGIELLGSDPKSNAVVAIEWPSNLADTEELQKLADAGKLKLYSVKILKLGEQQRRIILTELKS